METSTFSEQLEKIVEPKTTVLSGTMPCSTHTPLSSTAPVGRPIYVCIYTCVCVCVYPHVYIQIWV